MNYIINNAVLYARSFEELNIYRQGFTSFLTELDSLQNHKLADVIKNRENALINKQIGRSAPAFQVQDLEKHVHNLEEFKGKVVLLDLWASWCLPCRQQATFIHALYERHKNDERLKIVSIAVMDHEDAWRKAVDQDRPDWLQLFDANGDVQKAYVANSIPKFILIGKNGNIVSFDAPLPANDAEGLEQLLITEMNK